MLESFRRAAASAAQGILLARRVARQHGWPNHVANFSWCFAKLKLWAIPTNPMGSPPFELLATRSTRSQGLVVHAINSMANYTGLMWRRVIEARVDSSEALYPAEIWVNWVFLRGRDNREYIVAQSKVFSPPLLLSIEYQCARWVLQASRSVRAYRLKNQHGLQDNIGSLLESRTFHITDLNRV